MITLLLLVRATHMYVVVLHAHPVRGESHNQRNTTREVATTSPRFYNEPHRSLCEGWTPHDLHILVTAPFCCDRKSRAACAQSFAPWQQATIEITRRDHSIIVCSGHIHIFLFFAHIPFVVNHTINATPPERLQQYSFLAQATYAFSQKLRNWVARFNLLATQTIIFDSSKMLFSSRWFWQG